MDPEWITAVATASDGVLSESDLVEEYPYSPIARAASNPNADILACLLQLGINGPPEQIRLFGPNGRDGPSALPIASAAGLAKNVQLLLSAGANVNGPSLPHPGFLGSHYPRRLNSSEDRPLLGFESANRIYERQSFWQFERSYSLRHGEYDLKNTSTPLECAVYAGSIEIVDLLINYGHDTSYWVADSPLEARDAITAQSTSSPLHQAIATGRPDMVMYLLDLGFNPNALLAVYYQQCLSPLMASASLYPNLHIFKLLVSHPRADLFSRIPVSGISLLHLIASTLNLDFLRAFFSALSKTATKVQALQLDNKLQVTPLIVMCMPLTDHHIQHFSPKIHECIHELRGLSGDPPMARLTRFRAPRSIWHPSQRPSIESCVAGLPKETPKYDMPQQLACVELLLQEYGDAAECLRGSDIHGNTALHYLASPRTLNLPLIEHLRQIPSGEQIWTTAKNGKGHTPKDLFDDNQAAVWEPYKSFWTDTLEDPVIAAIETEAIDLGLDPDWVADELFGILGGRDPTNLETTGFFTDLKNSTFAQRVREARLRGGSGMTSER